MGSRLKLPKYVHGFIDRHGKARQYLRKPGCKQVALPDLPWSPAFMAAYEAGLSGELPPEPIGASKTKPGTINAVIVGYYTSNGWLSLRETTRKNRRAILERFRKEHGDKRVALLERRHLDKMLAGKARTPHAANNLLKVLRGLLDFVVSEEMRPDNPAASVKKLKVKEGGFLTWSEEHIEKFRRRYDLGTRARLALELAIGTGQSRADIVRMGRQHVRRGILSIRRQKTGVLVEIPVLPELKAAIDAMPASDNLTFLTTHTGEGLTAAGFGNWFLDVCEDAGIGAGYRAHGLRKAAATAHAEAGATAHELMAWFGWKTLAEAERYTRAAERKRLAQGMVKKLGSGTRIGKPDRRFAKSSKKMLKIQRSE